MLIHHLSFKKQFFPLLALVSCLFRDKIGNLFDGKLEPKPTKSKPTKLSITKGNKHMKIAPAVRSSYHEIAEVI